MNILVVDDEADVKPLFEQRFRKEIRNGESSFSFALSASEAFAYLEQHPAETSIILSDINMPGMSGIELLRQVRMRYNAPPPVIVMITAYNDQELHQQVLQNGADDFLTKPLDFRMLKNKLKMLAL
ncbi:response regulator [Pontibacter sp. E15-1]|uniref:response regulator n=1 Tax=Pontibacter sp. E15-1 TaxID=2919918 RepID=UPI001F4F8762|nr:response regulator [Pontibacter sp. E15-1]MCJ8164198.1 response regulator [Pontibacter sp. E15-1]